MAFPLSVQAIAGVAAGGFAVLVTVGISWVMVITRAKDRRLRARTNAAGGRRHSRHSGGLMSITDQDVMRMPGGRAALRRSLQLQSTRSPYTPMSSRNTLEARRTSRSSSQTRTSHQVDHEPVQAWPLPRRLQRSHASSIGKIQSTSASPITGRSKKPITKASETKDTIKMVESPGQNHHTRPTHPAADKGHVQGTIAGAEASPRADLTPKPLFYGKQRSISHSMITKLAEPGRAPPPGVFESEDPTPRPLDRPPLPRSTSMYDQPGLAPTDLLPPLPFQIPAESLQRVKSPADSSTRRLSYGTSFSDNTSILDDDIPKTFSRTETDRTSVGILSALNLESATEYLDDQNFSRPPWDSTDHEGRINPLGAVKPLTFRPPLTSQKSFRVSIHDSLPKSKISGLSINMSLRGPSRTASSTDLSKDTSAIAQTRLPTQSNIEKGCPRRKSSPSSRRGRSDIFDIYEDAKGSQSSTAPLQSISGNGSRVASSPTKTRASSIADSPQRWEMLASMHQRNPSMFNARGSFHKPQSSMPVSNMTKILPLAQPANIEEQTEHTKENPSPDTVVRKQTSQESKFRPPSIPAFSPQIAPPAHTDIPIRTENPFSQPLSMTTDSDEDGNSDLEAYTPTRRPSRRHPNRLKSIFDTSGMTSRPLPNTPDPLQLRMVEQQKQEQGVKRRSVFSINFPNFPNPPKNQPRRHDLPNWRGPGTPIRGPRAPPSGFQFSPTRSSPSRGVSKARGNSPSKGLSPSKIPRKNVLALENAAALRRQNSEASSEAFTMGSNEHKRYLSIGSRENDVFEDPDQPVESMEGREEVREMEGVNRPRAMFSRIPKSAKNHLQGKGVARWNADEEADV